MPLDPQIAAFLDFVNAAPSMATMTPAEARAAFRTMCVDLRKPETLEPVGSVQDAQVAGAEGDLAARIYRPQGAGAVPTLALFHGGGFVIGDLDTHDAMARAICAGANVCVVSVDYRLAPEATYPAAAHDAIAATTHIRERLDQYGGSEVLAVGGDSAGGNLSAVAAQQVDGLAAQFLIYPAVDVLGDYQSRAENAEGYFLDMETMAWFINHYAPALPDEATLSPIGGSLAGLPPAVVLTAQYDPLRDEGASYAAALAGAGVHVVHRDYPGMIHGFMDMDAISEAAKPARDDGIAQFANLIHPAS